MGDYVVRYDSEDALLVVELRGEFDAHVLSASTAAMVKELPRSGCQRILMDHRNALPHLSVVEQFKRPEVAAGLGVPKTCSLALVYREDHELYRFIETVGRNRGFRVRIFPTIEEAVEWLRTSCAC